MKVESRYECRKCFALYKDTHSATECCRSLTSHYFTCGKCGHLWLTKQAAQSCCDSFDCDLKGCTWKNRKLAEVVNV